MKKLEQFKTKELDKTLKSNITGGGEWYSGGCSNGGGMQYEGPVQYGPHPVGEGDDAFVDNFIYWYMP